MVPSCAAINFNLISSSAGGNCENSILPSSFHPFFTRTNTAAEVCGVKTQSCRSRPYNVIHLQPSMTSHSSTTKQISNDTEQLLKRCRKISGCFSIRDSTCAGVKQRVQRHVTLPCIAAKDWLHTDESLCLSLLGEVTPINIRHASFAASSLGPFSNRTGILSNSEWKQSPSSCCRRCMAGSSFSSTFQPR